MIELENERRVEQSRRKNSICFKERALWEWKNRKPSTSAAKFRAVLRSTHGFPPSFPPTELRMNFRRSSLRQIETIKSRRKLRSQVFLISVIAGVIKSVEMSRAKYQSVSFDYSINVLWLLPLLLRCKAKGNPANVDLEISLQLGNNEGR